MSGNFKVSDPPGAPPDLPPDVPIVTSLPVRPWVDAVSDTIGFDPRSAYVERFWLGLLGPSTTWFLRRVADAFDRHPEGFDLELSEMATDLGLGHKGGRHSPFMRAMWRACQFDLARLVGDTFEVRRRLPPLHRRQVERLSPRLREEHHAWLETPPVGRDTDPLRAAAAAMLAEDLDLATVEQRLIRWGIHPALAHDACAHASW